MHYSWSLRDTLYSADIPTGRITEGMEDSLFYNSWIPQRGQEYRKGWEEPVRRWIKRFHEEGCCPALKILLQQSYLEKSEICPWNLETQRMRAYPRNSGGWGSGPTALPDTSHPGMVICLHDRGKGLCCGLPTPPKLLPPTHVSTWGVLGPQRALGRHSSAERSWICCRIQELGSHPTWVP